MTVDITTLQSEWFQVGNRWRLEAHGFRAAVGPNPESEGSSWYWTANDLRNKASDQQFGNAETAESAQAQAELAIYELSTERKTQS